MRLIGFNGIMGSGKSTAIELVKQLSGTNVANVKFAQPLYDMQTYIYHRIASAHKVPIDFVKDRRLLQWLGTEWGRGMISQSIWIDLWKADVTAKLKYAALATEDDKTIIVCDDVRFDNEGEAIKDLGGFVIQIKVNESRAEAKHGIANHASEAGIDKKYIDVTIDNNGTIEDLKNSLQRANTTLGIW